MLDFNGQKIEKGNTVRLVNYPENTGEVVRLSKAYNMVFCDIGYDNTIVPFCKPGQCEVVKVNLGNNE